MVKIKETGIFNHKVFGFGSNEAPSGVTSNCTIFVVVSGVSNDCSSFNIGIPIFYIFNLCVFNTSDLIISNLEVSEDHIARTLSDSCVKATLPTSVVFKNSRNFRVFMVRIIITSFKVAVIIR